MELLTTLFGELPGSSTTSWLNPKVASQRDISIRGAEGFKQLKIDLDATLGDLNKLAASAISWRI
jgi:hypothetical protein